MIFNGLLTHCSGGSSLKSKKHFLCVAVGGRWKVVAERLGLRGSAIEFLNERYRNPSEATLAFAAKCYGMNVDDLYEMLIECGWPVLADVL